MSGAISVSHISFLFSGPKILFFFFILSSLSLSTFFYLYNFCPKKITIRSLHAKSFVFSNCSFLCFTKPVLSDFMWQLQLYTLNLKVCFEICYNHVNLLLIYVCVIWVKFDRVPLNRKAWMNENREFEEYIYIYFLKVREEWEREERESREIDERKWDVMSGGRS